jgi:hypothetical protein
MAVAKMVSTRNKEFQTAMMTLVPVKVSVLAQRTLEDEMVALKAFEMVSSMETWKVIWNSW